MHLNIGKPYPRVQVILWRGWKGLRWHRWERSVLIRGSLLIGWLELRFWRAQ